MFDRCSECGNPGPLVWVGAVWFEARRWRVLRAARRAELAQARADQLAARAFAVEV